MIQFTYRLSGPGWAVATIGDEHRNTTFPASYLCDALRDFVDAVQSLFAIPNAECAWEQEPGEVKWTFQRRGERVRVQVAWHDGREEFAGEDDFLHFSAEVMRELDLLLANWGADGYLKQWRHRFPQEATVKLEAGVRAELERRKTSL